MGFKHHREEELESTNKYLWEFASQELLPNFYTVSTAYQNMGRGQGENFWESAKGQNILMSTIINPQNLLAENAFYISRWASLSIISYLKNKGLKNLKIKWPNDIYIDSKKIAGILIQNVISGHNISKSMIGIGLNVNQSIFTSNAPNPVSLVHLKSSRFNILNEIKLLIKEMQIHYNWIEENPQLLIDTYHELLYQKNEWHNYESKKKQFRGRIKGVDQFGQLIVEAGQGESYIFDIKDIRFL